MAKKKVQNLEVGDKVMYQNKELEVTEVSSPTSRTAKYLVSFSNDSTVTFTYDESLTIIS